MGLVSIDDGGHWLCLMLVEAQWYLCCVLWVVGFSEAVRLLLSGGLGACCHCADSRSAMDFRDALVTRKVSGTAENISSLLR